MKIHFVVMPFKDPNSPAIGVSNLKTLVQESGQASQVLYENLHFLSRFGPDVYQFFSSRASSLSLALFGSER